MPGGRRNISRSSAGRPQFPPPSVALNDDASKSRAGAEGLSARSLAPKHIPVPGIPQDGCIMFEVLMLVFTTAMSCLQFLHLYRSVWWLPQSFTRYAMNFYLIDLHLVGFIGTILSRRLVYCVLWHVLAAWLPAHAWPLARRLLRLVILGVVLACLVWCAYHIMQSHPLMNMFFLCYPMFVYFILFGLRISPFFDVNSLPSSKDDTKDHLYYGKPLHNCSSSPHAIRDEVEGLKTDFNSRMKQILYSSVLNAYYAGFVPCCFAQSFLYYDVYWATQHLVFVWLGCFFMYLVHCCPVRYCDVLHRAALHLGHWVRVEGRSTHIPSHTWADATLWHQGALVKHCKELYRAEAVCNAAEPGNHAHSRFYAVFSNPTSLVVVLVSLQGLVVGVQLGVLIGCSEWHHVLSLGVLLFANYHTLFKLARDYMVCWRMYGVERLLQQRAAD